MEPRHQDFAAEEVARDRQAEPSETGPDGQDQSGADVVDDLNPDGDDTGYDKEIEDEG
jgi:hypothetical protein